MTQILPPDDAFAHGTPNYGAFQTLYLGCNVTTGTTVPWNPSAAGFIARPMHGAYQTTDTLGIHDYNSAFHNNGTSASRTVSGAMFRAPFGTDVTASATFEMRSLAGGAPTIADLAPRGVMARLSGGTLVGDGTADVRYRDVDGYMAAVYQKTSDSTLRLAVYRVNAGVFTLIGAESASLATVSTIFTALATVTLTVSGTGATVTLQAKLTGFGSAATLTLNRSDTDASRVVVAGRCGYFSGSDRIVSGKTVVDLCHLFAVDEGGVRKVQDEFRRVSLAAAKQTTADVFGTAGSGYLSSAYYWDAATFDGSFSAGGKTYTGSKRFRRNATAGRVDFDHQVTDDDVNAGRLILSQRPADNRFSQHRSVAAIIPTAPTASTGEVWAGIILRARQAQPLDENPPTIGINSSPNFPGNGTAGTGGTGYMFVCRGISSSSVTWQLHRITNNSHIPIARLTEFVIFPGYGSSFTMELDCYPQNAADPLGPVRLTCKVDGTEIALVLTATAIGLGMFSPATGVFVDPTSTRIKQNEGEGLVTANGFARVGSASADIDPVFFSWTQGALTNAAVLDQDQASVVLASEGAATGSALDTIIGPDWPFEIEHRSHTVSNPFESGHRQTMPRFVDSADALLGRKGYKFRRRGVRRAELDDLLAHWDAHNGLELPFNFSAPGEPAQKVRYVEDSLQYSMSAPGTFDVAFELESLT